MTVWVAVTDFVMVVGVLLADAAVEIVIVLVAKGQVLKVVGYVPVDPEFKVSVKVVVEIIVETDVETEGVRVEVTVDVTVDAGRVMSSVTAAGEAVVVTVVVVVEIDVETKTEAEHDAVVVTVSVVVGCRANIKKGPLSAVLPMISVI